ncbi:hypothetical protein HDV06_007004 [Boothiomyces sp. JEL0866]|nr:hypothetical protein HDV06_007004 [Boothiomyces sp. JEL0866]
MQSDDIEMQDGEQLLGINPDRPVNIRQRHRRIGKKKQRLILIAVVSVISLFAILFMITGLPNKDDIPIESPPVVDHGKDQQNPKDHSIENPKVDQPDTSNDNHNSHTDDKHEIDKEIETIPVKEDSKTNTVPPVQPTENNDQPQKKPVTFQMLGGYQSSGYLNSDNNWVKSPLLQDGTTVYMDNGIIKMSHVEYGNETVLANVNDFKTDNGVIIPSNWELSNDMEYILLTANVQNGWRHSFFADYYIYNIREKTTKPLTLSKSDKIIEHEIGSGRIALVLWAPVGHNLVWVRDNDLHFTVDGHELQVTTDGSKNIINGISDWVYEEEVLNKPQSSWLSLDGSAVAYLKYNETLVKDFELQYYDKAGFDQYPQKIDYKYPKPGTPNPTVTLHVAQVSNLQIANQEIQLPEVFQPEDLIFAELKWLHPNGFIARCMNRIQNHQKVYLVEFENSKWTATLTRDEKTSDGAWFTRMHSAEVIKGSYLELLDNEEGYVHIAYFKDAKSSKPEWLTSGKYEVDSIKGITDEYIYYISTEVHSTQRHLYKVSFTGEKTQMTPVEGVKKFRIVKEFEKPIGQEIGNEGYYDARFSPGCTYYSVAYLGPDIPWQRFEKTDDPKFGKFTGDWDSYQTLHETYELPQLLYLSVPIEGDELNCKVILPPNFDKAKKYPVLFEIYGGPNHQKVNKVYSVDYLYRLSAYGFIGVSVDARGTGFKGRKFRTSVYKNLGKHESQDFITTAKYLADQYSFIDSARIGIWGWSFGGFLTAKTIEQDSTIFSLGMAVAPVTDWKLYDSIYTETPDENPEGYKESAISRMNGFRNAKFLMIHGTGDDNVHFQNSARLVWKLTGAGVDSYTVQYYTDSDHSMGANGAQMQVYKLLTTFICSNFQMECK